MANLLYTGIAKVAGLWISFQQLLSCVIASAFIARNHVTLSTTSCFLKVHTRLLLNFLLPEGSL